MKELADMLTYPEDVEPRRIDIVHDFGAFDYTNEEDAPNEPPYVEGQLAAQVPSKILAYAFSARLFLVKVWLFVLIDLGEFENPQALLFISA